jgi:hypothetical protein
MYITSREHFRHSIKKITCNLYLGNLQLQNNVSVLRIQKHINSNYDHDKLPVLLDICSWEF